MQPNCVWLAVLCAATVKLHGIENVRIAVTHIEPGIDHSQAQARINGKWTFLTEQWTGEHLEVVIWPSHYPDKKPYRYLTLQDWIDEQMLIVNPK